MTSGITGTLIMDGEDLTAGIPMDLETGVGIAGIHIIVIFTSGIDNIYRMLKLEEEVSIVI